MEKSEATQDRTAELLQFFAIVCALARGNQITGWTEYAEKNCQEIRKVLEGQPEVDEQCTCESYRWLKQCLLDVVVFMGSHGLPIVETRGPFKFCPYCGKPVRIKEE